MRLLAIGKKLTHTPTGRPVIVAAISDISFTVHTLDDIWPHPKTGKPWGGSAWELSWDSANQFKEEINHDQ